MRCERTSFSSDRGGVDVIHRDVEEALDLVGVQVDGQHAVDTGRSQHVGDQFGGDRHTRGTRTAILAGVAEVRDGGGDTTGGGALERVGHGQDFHQIVVGRVAGGLQDEHVATAHVFEQLHCHLAIAELAHVGAAERDVQMLDHVLGEFRVSGPGENHQTVVCRHNSLCLS